MITLWLLLACGRDLASDSGPVTPEVCEPTGSPAAPLRMLTRAEIDRSVEDLLDVPGTASTRLPPDPTVGGFEGFASVVTVGALQADGAMRAAEDVSAALDWAALLPCDPAAGDQACAEAFIDGFVPRAFRRPLSEDERAIFVALYAALEPTLGFEEAMSAVVEATLQSPQFLYKLEPEGEATSLSPYALATRLSFLLWASTPDDALLAAAADGSLLDPEVLAAQAERLLADPRADEALGRFVSQWMQLGELEGLSKDALAYPDWTPELAAALEEETQRFFAEVVLRGDGQLSTLLGADYTVANALVAEHYGLDSGGGGWAVVDLPPGERAGLLTHASLLARAAHSDQTSPVHRGLFVYEQLLCGEQPDPPGDLDISLPPLDDTVSTRERLTRHVQDPDCSGCHRVMDPIGFGLEHYDAVGRWRETEGQGLPIDATGQLLVTEQAGRFYGALELSERLLATPELRQCFALQWFRYAHGREPGEADACALAELEAALGEGDVRALLLALPQTQSFQTRAPVDP